MHISMCVSICWLPVFSSVQFLWIYTQEWNCWVIGLICVETSWGTSILFPYDCTILHSHQQYTEAPISPYLSQHLLLLLFNSSYPSGCEVVSVSLWFWFAFPWWFKWCWISFHMWAYVDTFFGEISIQILCPFLIRLFGFLLLSCSFLCILLVNSLSDVYFANKFFL